MNGILVCSGDGQKKNIGDYIQSVAQEQFFEHTDCYVEREHMDTFSSKEKVNVIMNAWFMWHPENFPPSESINPLFISFHLVPKTADVFFNPKTIAYLKKYEPIGARDIGTKKLLEAHGIKSYFSGCLTLTLGLKYKENSRCDRIYFVDPHYNIIGADENFGKARKLFIALKIYLRNFKTINILQKRFHAEYKIKYSKYSKKLSDWYCCISFYHTYSKVFTDEVLINAEYLTHDLPQSLFRNNEDKMQYAKSLIHKYAKAKLVVSSRLHCALPCIALGTPTIFINSQKLEEGVSRGGSNGRFDGLIDLMNTLYCEGYDIIAKDNIMKMHLRQKISLDSEIPVSEKHQTIKKNLIDSVRQWVLLNDK